MHWWTDRSDLGPPEFTLCKPKALQTHASVMVSGVGRECGRLTSTGGGSLRPPPPQTLQPQKLGNSSGTARAAREAEMGDKAPRPSELGELARCLRQERLYVSSHLLLGGCTAIILSPHLPQQSHLALLSPGQL